MILVLCTANTNVTAAQNVIPSLKSVIDRQNVKMDQMNSGVVVSLNTLSAQHNKMLVISRFDNYWLLFEGQWTCDPT